MTKSFRHLVLPAVLAFLLPFVCTPTVRADANPSLKWAVGFPPYNVTDAQAKELAKHFDLMVVEPGNENFAGLVRPYNPNFLLLRYDNITNINHGSHRDKWLAMQNYCAANGQDFERMFLHFSEDTRTHLNNDTPAYYLLSGGGYGTAYTYTGGALNDQSYWATGSDAGTSTTFCPAVGDMVYAGHYDKFSAVDIALSQVASSGWNAAWEYLRTDSTWAALSVTDGTNHMTQAGLVRFTPPVDWGWRSVGGNRNYWVRARCTQSAATPPKWRHLWKESYCASGGGGGWFIVPGWDSRNDANGDGYVTDSEFSARVNTNCSARFKYQARVPTFYWNSQRNAANVGDPLYRQLSADWQLGRCNADFGGGQHLSGIFEDNCTFQDGSVRVLSDTTDLADSLRVGLYTCTTGGHILEYPGQGPGRRFHQDHLRADSTAHATLKAGSKIIEGNASQYYGDFRFYNYPPSNVTTITRGDSGGFFGFSVHDGCMREFWAIPKTCVVEGGYDSPTVAALAQFKMAKELSSNGHFGRFMMRSSYDDPDYGPATITAQRDKMFALAYGAMVARPTAYLGWMPVGSIAKPESTQWWPAVGYNFGTPQSDSIHTFQTGTDANGEPYVIYARYFTNAVVLIKPKAHYNSPFSDNLSPLTVVNLPRALQRLNYDGTLGAAATQITLKNIEGAIMVGSVTEPGKQGGGNDSIPPSPAVLDYTFRAEETSPPSQGVASTHATIKVDLNDVIDKSSVNSGTITVTGSVSGVHPGAVSGIGRYLTFTPASTFVIGEVVTVRVSTNLRSTTGHSLDGDSNGSPGGDKVWSFSVSDH